ncbi:unnamed protein product [Arabidopsis lyrata]|nr:unnamed protein product [Arabidopsis lyrata]
MSKSQQQECQCFITPLSHQICFTFLSNYLSSQSIFKITSGVELDDTSTQCYSIVQASLKFVH